MELLHWTRHLKQVFYCGLLLCAVSSTTHTDHQSRQCHVWGYMLCLYSCVLYIYRPAAFILIIFLMRNRKLNCCGLSTSKSIHKEKQIYKVQVNMRFICKPSSGQCAHVLANDGQHNFICPTSNRQESHISVRTADTHLCSVAHTSPILQATVR